MASASAQRQGWIRDDFSSKHSAPYHANTVYKCNARQAGAALELRSRGLFRIALCPRLSCRSFFTQRKDDIKMRLINTTTLEIKQFSPSYPPPHAILSHTWDDEEVSFAEIQSDQSAVHTRRGFRKVVNFCSKARELGYDYAWMDTCCIDKRNSAELSESINSMYRYYKNAAVCMVYLSDVTVQSNSGEVPKSIRTSRWLSRGWTLQELIAPAARLFFDATWNLIDDEEVILHEIQEATGIPQSVLQNSNEVVRFCAAERMSWASKRQTTREEDTAYCLMGLFDIYMPPIYGEGGENAFRRLQIAIMQVSFDQTLFAWRGPYKESGLLAHAPSDFRDSSGVSIWGPRYLSPYGMTNVGLSIRVVDVSFREGGAEDDPDIVRALVQSDVNVDGRDQGLAVYLKPVEGAYFWSNGLRRPAYRRVRCAEWLAVGRSCGSPFRDILVLEDSHERLVVSARLSDLGRWGRELLPPSSR